MAFDETLAARIRTALARKKGIEEKKMLGGVGFLLNGNMLKGKEEITMRYKLLGKSGLRVSELCLGTMTFGEDWGWGSSKDTAKGVFDAFIEAGGNFLDTANLYTNGSSERLLGEFIHADRNRYVVATKYTLNMDGKGDPNAAGNHRKNMVQA